MARETNFVLWRLRKDVATYPRFGGHPIKGLALCLFGGDRADGGREPPTIVGSFDGGEQAVPGGIGVWGTSLVPEIDF